MLSHVVRHPFARGVDRRSPPAPDPPDDPFPEELLELPLEQLQILHSRICRQLEGEYLTDPQGAHPITQDRLHELQIEFTSRLLH